MNLTTSLKTWMIEILFNKIQNIWIYSKRKISKSHTERTRKGSLQISQITPTDHIKKIRALTLVSTNKLVRCKLQFSQPCQYGLVHLCRLQRCVAACVRDTRTLPHWCRMHTYIVRATTVKGDQQRYAVNRRAARLFLADFPSFVRRKGGETCSFRNIGK